MKVLEEKEIDMVNQYLNASCFNEINDRTYEKMLNYESKADPIEMKLITRIKEQVRRGKVVLSSRSKDKT